MLCVQELVVTCCQWSLHSCCTYHQCLSIQCLLLAQNYHYEARGICHWTLRIVAVNSWNREPYRNHCLASNGNFHRQGSWSNDCHSKWSKFARINSHSWSSYEPQQNAAGSDLHCSWTSWMEYQFWALMITTSWILVISRASLITYAELSLSTGAKASTCTEEYPYEGFTKAQHHSVSTAIPLWCSRRYPN